MTRDEIENMPAGREMDICVAKYVMEKVSCDQWVIGPMIGQHWNDGKCDHDCFPAWAPPEYTKNISAAWQVVEKMKSSGWSVFISLYNDERNSEVCITKGLGNKNYAADYDEPPLVICRAALLATFA